LGNWRCHQRTNVSSQSWVGGHLCCWADCWETESHQLQCHSICHLHIPISCIRWAVWGATQKKW
jgi:hypothetical protein